MCSWTEVVGCIVKRTTPFSGELYNLLAFPKAHWTAATRTWTLCCKIPKAVDVQAVPVLAILVRERAPPMGCEKQFCPFEVLLMISSIYCPRPGGAASATGFTPRNERGGLPVFREHKTQRLI